MKAWATVRGMLRLRGSAAVVANHPAAFVRAVLKGFRANQGLLLAGAVAYYALLSLIPLLILVLIALSHLIDEARLLATLREYLEFAVPGQSGALVEELRAFLAHRDALGGLLLATMLFFSALAFTVLENAMSVIFFHRVAVRRRHFLVSATMPYLFILFLAVGLLVVTVVAGRLQILAGRHISVFGELFTMDALSATLFGLSPLDPASFAGVSLLLIAIALPASNDSGSSRGGSMLLRLKRNSDTY